MCAKRRLRSAWASESSLSAWRSLGPWLPIEGTAKTLIRLDGCPGWSETSLGAQSFCWFCHEAAHIWNERSVHILWIAFKMMASVRFCLSYDVFERIFITLKLPLFQQKMKGCCRWHHGITGHWSSVMWCIVKTNVVQVVINLSLLHAQNLYLNQQNDVRPLKTQTSLTAWVSAQSDQSLCYPPEESLHPWLPTKQTAKTDQISIKDVKWERYITTSILDRQTDRQTDRDRQTESWHENPINFMLVNQ